MKRHSLRGRLSLMMTPMIDIVFQLIAFFIFALSHSADGVSSWIQPPTGDAAEEESVRAAVLIEIDAQGRVLMPGGEAQADEHDRQRVVDRLLETRPADQPVVIRADESAPYEAVDLVLESLRRHRVPTIALRLRLEKP